VGAACGIGVVIGDIADTGDADAVVPPSGDEPGAGAEAIGVEVGCEILLPRTGKFGFE
jgi:hypothetical protein